MTSSLKSVHIVGGGLAGSEAAWQLASAGVPVVLHEMRPVRGTEAHQTDQLAELVCSNSFRSDDAANNAVGVIHEEMRRAGSLIMRAADAHKLPAGGALAVDRVGFSLAVQEALLAHPLVTLERAEVAGLPPEEWDSVIVATGPLTSAALAEAIAKVTGEESLAFFDAIAPIVHHESIDQTTAWKQSRYDKGGPAGDGADYYNCPMDKQQYDAFVAALLSGDKTEFKQWEGTPLLPGLPADRGDRRLRSAEPALRADEAGGPARSAHRPSPVGRGAASPGQCAGHAVEHRGLPDQAEAWRADAHLPHHSGLEKAEFARLGGLHRNTFLNSPRLLDGTLRLRQCRACASPARSPAAKVMSRVQPSALLTGRFAAAERLGFTPSAPPPTTAMGALLGHITGGADAATFQPMNINFGLFPPIEGSFKGKERKQAMAVRALRDFDHWLGPTPLAAE